jgi:hypothetical protein
MTGATRGAAAPFERSLRDLRALRGCRSLASGCSFGVSCFRDGTLRGNTSCDRISRSLSACSLPSLFFGALGISTPDVDARPYTSLSPVFPVGHEGDGRRRSRAERRKGHGCATGRREFPTRFTERRVGDVRLAAASTALIFVPGLSEVSTICERVGQECRVLFTLGRRRRAAGSGTAIGVLVPISRMDIRRMIRARSGCAPCQRITPRVVA